ncbi:MAG: DUF92 domain-containing protein [Vulcanimicrobiaceae bacterium]
MLIPSIGSIALGALLAACIALPAWRAKALTAGGAGIAVLVGATTWGVGGWPAALVLFAFFLPSTLLSRLGRARKQGLVDAGKLGPRDGRQVLANGGVASLCVLASIHFGAPLAAAFAGAYAAASADTWATEIGTLVRGLPRSILTFAPLPTGLSGGVTWQGTLAQAGGAVCVALVAGGVHVAPVWPVALGGFAGALADSVLGASLQERRWCDPCGRTCETNPHVCGAPTRLQRGYAWMNNDTVNWGATIVGALVAGASVALLAA